MIRKNILLICCTLLCSLPLLLSCQNDDDTDSSEYHDWQARNEAYFESIRSNALDSIRQAQTTYGNGWASHCNWKTFLNYSLDSTLTNKATDSIYVQVINKGTGSGCPLSTDSARVFYRGHLIPSESYTEGYVFSHSGQSSKYEDIFNKLTSIPTMIRPTAAVKGFGTALQQMHIGDRWRVFVPCTLGYNSTEKTGIPAYSTLIFEIELVSYYRNGTAIDPWN